MFKNEEVVHNNLDSNQATSRYQKTLDPITIKLEYNSEISALIYLSNGCLVSGEYKLSNHRYAKINAWEIQSGQHRSELITNRDQVVEFFKIENEIIIASYEDSYIEFYDFSLPTFPKKLAEAKLANGETIIKIARISSNCFAFISYNITDQYHTSNLGLLYFDIKSMSNESISIKYLETPNMSWYGQYIGKSDYFYGHLFSLNSEELLLADNDKMNVFVSDKNKIFCTKTIQFPKSGKCPHIELLNNGKVFVAQQRLTYGDAQSIINIYDVTSKKGCELLKTVTISHSIGHPIRNSVVFQKNNGEILILVIDEKGVFIHSLDCNKNKMLSYKLNLRIQTFWRYKFIDEDYLLIYIGDIIKLLPLPPLTEKLIQTNHAKFHDPEEIKTSNTKSSKKDKAPETIKNSEDDLTDDDEESFLDRETKAILERKKLKPIEGLAWKKVKDTNGKYKHRARIFSTNNSIFHDSYQNLSKELNNRGFVSSFFSEKKEDSEISSITVTLRAK